MTCQARGPLRRSRCVGCGIEALTKAVRAERETVPGAGRTSQEGSSVLMSRDGRGFPEWLAGTRSSRGSRRPADPGYGSAGCRGKLPPSQSSQNLEPPECLAPPRYLDFILEAAAGPHRAYRTGKPGGWMGAFHRSAGWRTHCSCCLERPSLALCPHQTPLRCPKRWSGSVSTVQ